MAGALNAVLGALKAAYGEEWLNDEDANEQFASESRMMLDDLAGAHLIGDPALEEERVTFTIWVDDEVEDLLAIDQIAFDIFARISEELFFAERVITARRVEYPFITGSSRHGHRGVVVLAGPNAADFAQRHQLRTIGGIHFHA